MSVVLEYAIGPERVALSETIDAVPDLELELERSYAIDPDQPILLTWVTATDYDAFEAAVETDATAEGFEVLSEADGSRLYRIATAEELPVALYPKWVELGAVRRDARYEDGWWHASMQFPTREAATEYRQYLERNDVTFRLKRLYSESQRDLGDSPLTEEQRETLELAYERGYFDIPRTVTMTELAAELGVSDQAVSERLRRGYARLLEASDV